MTPVSDTDLTTFGDLHPDDDRDLYLIQNLSTNGDLVLWWREHRTGYTDSLDEAGVYTRADALRQQRSRKEDRAVPVHLARKAAHAAVYIYELNEAFDVG